MPEHKAQVTTALRVGSRTTGFLGDGVNDMSHGRGAAGRTVLF
ncbi:hypothetical protein ACFXKC_57350 [Streptomyces sp. NPDC059340]